jgi:hypothetical protein
MRIVGRYFVIGATLGSVSGLVALVLVWTWLTIHLGPLGLLLGWIPAGVVAAGLWLAMVIFWGPILIVGAMVSMVLLMLRAHTGLGWSRWERAPDHPSEAVYGPRDAEAPPPPNSDRQIGSEPLPESVSPPSGQAGDAPAPSAAEPQTQPAAAAAATTDDLGGDAAAAGDTSHRRQR